LSRKVEPLPAFRRDFSTLPDEIRNQIGTKISLYLQNPSHPSLRVKKMKGVAGIWELSLTMNYRLTFQVTDELMILRRVGTHDVLRKP
jgi:mRNA-degrading endonuclease RelE of RelBE toxin-antitoxin system